MAKKKCCVEYCKSCSTRSEDNGVTYHKFPKVASLRNVWMKITQCKITNTDSHVYVCSRHFCKKDFKVYKDSKYILKSEAVPSIFSWSNGKEDIINMEVDNSDDIQNSDVTANDVANTSGSSKESECENVDAIKKFIEDQEKEIQRDAQGAVTESSEQADPIVEPGTSMSVMNMILNDSDSFDKKKDMNLPKQNMSPGDKGTMALSVGSKIEAKDYTEIWHRAEILEVDYDEMEVLVHYDSTLKRQDEWINVSSPRLRPQGNAPTVEPKRDSPPTPVMEPTANTTKEEPKVEDKTKVLFAVGERCLARWRDNRRFMATVQEELENGTYVIVFDDGFQWKCTASRLSKIRQSGPNEPLTIDTVSPSHSNSAPSPDPTKAPLSTIPVFHTHLFDPTRDYLGSKSERREMKRKLNIKEIFNIGQKKQRKNPDKEKAKAVERKPRIIRRKVAKSKNEPKVELKTEIPDAVASIIGTVLQETVKEESNPEEKLEVKNDNEVETQEEDDSKELIDDKVDITDIVESPGDTIIEVNPDNVTDEEAKLENFEMDDVKHEEVIGRIKEVINKLEGGLNNVEKPVAPVAEVKAEPKPEIEIKPEPNLIENDKGKIKKLKIKKSKKLRLLQEKKVKKQVEKVKCELEEMKRQVEEMKKQMMMKTEELAKSAESQEMPDSFLLAGEWCCKWLNGQPLGAVSEIEGDHRTDGHKTSLPRRSVQVEDKRLPPGWTKHMVRRSYGNSAGKWDVVLVSPENFRFHTKADMRNFLENNPDQSLRPYEHALYDFGVHMKLARRMGWVKFTPDGVVENPVAPLPIGLLNSSSPLVKRRKLSLNRPRKTDSSRNDRRKRKMLKMPRKVKYSTPLGDAYGSENISDDPFAISDTIENEPLEDGYVYVGALKVQVIENLLRCPADNCLKNFRNNTLLKMHIKHYHRELRALLGATPKVLDLASARTKPTQSDIMRLTGEVEQKIIKVKLPRLKLPKRFEEPKPEIKEEKLDIPVEPPTTPLTIEEKIPRGQESPKLRNALINKPVKRPRVLLPVRRPEPLQVKEEVEPELPTEPLIEVPELVAPLDFETAISTHTVTKPLTDKKKSDKKRSFANFVKKPVSEEDDWFTGNSDVDTQSSFPRSGTPDSKNMDFRMLGYSHAVSSESNEDAKEQNNYMYSETGERIKIVHMKREEIINCHCGFREEDGLMVQCELCLCWQHALCHNIQKESEVPEKYTCSICLSPRRGRRSQRFLHDQDRLYEGLLPGAKACDSLRRSHELSGNLHRIEDALHSLKIKNYVATKKDHPKLYLWAKDWETVEINMTQEKLNSDYSDLNIMISNIGKENLPVKPDDLSMEMRTPLSEDSETDRFSQQTPFGGQSLLGNLLSSPSGASLDLHITTSELERLAKSVQEQESCGVAAPQPEAAIENSACRERLLRHIQRCQALIDARLDSIEAQVAELESQDPSFEDDETADYFPRTKQTIQMLMRDLDTMEELGVIT